ncbi:MAG: AMP-binding protein [candidate division WOR-3 bacterium]
MKKLDKPVRKVPTIRSGFEYITIPQMVEAACNKYSEYIAYTIPRENKIYSLTYGQVYEMIRKLARYLKDLGCQKGEHIAILSENRPEWPISYFAISWIGGVVIPLDSRLDIEAIKFILSFSNTVAIITSKSFYADIKSIKEEVPSLRNIILMEEFDDIYNKYYKGIDYEKVELDDLLEILFTSGTTGDPKGVMLTHKNIISNVCDIYQIINFTPEDRLFSILPIHHSYECTIGTITPFYSGVSVFYARSLKPSEMLEDLRIAKPTYWLNVPLILEKLLIRINKQIKEQKGFKKIIVNVLPKKAIGNQVKKQLGLDKIKFIISGGAALPKWVSEGLSAYGFPILQGYGLSEASPLVSVNPPSKPKNESVGMIIPSVDARIVNIDSEGNGEIWVKGPNIMKGYYKNETATREVLTIDNWLITGDVGYFDEEGYLYITGRKKFVIVTKGGKNIFPEEIEEKLTKSDLIEEALVFSPDDENIQAIIYPNLEEVRISLEKIGKEFNDENVWNLIKLEVEKVNETLEAYKRIRHFAIRYDEFPKTTTRKIKRHLFKALRLTPDIKVLKG